MEEEWKKIFQYANWILAHSEEQGGKLAMESNRQMAEEQSRS